MHLPPAEAPQVNADPLEQFLANIPDSILGPLVTNLVIGVIIVAVAFGLAARRLNDERKARVLEAVDIGFELIIIVLHWVIALVPLAVFCKVAATVAEKGFGPFKALGWFIVAVLVALVVQATYYLARVWLFSWVSPKRLLAGTTDARGRCHVRGLHPGTRIAARTAAFGWSDRSTAWRRPTKSRSATTTRRSPFWTTGSRRPRGSTGAGPAAARSTKPSSKTRRTTSRPRRIGSSA